MIRCQLMAAGHRTDGHHLGVLDARQPTSKRTEDGSQCAVSRYRRWVHNNTVRRTVLKVSDLPLATVMHPPARTPTVRALG